MVAGMKKPVLLPTIAGIALLTSMLLAGSAHGELLIPHVERPDAVTAHVVSPPAVTDPAPAAQSEESASPGDSNGSDPASLPAVASPTADSPKGDGPKPAPEGNPCTPKPGHTCPYFCPHGLLNCEEPILIPLFREDGASRRSLGEWMETVHLCAANRPIVYMVDFYAELADAFDVDVSRDPEAFLGTIGLDGASYAEALNIVNRLNCQNLVEM
jgi:hypothetical protein